MSSSRWHAWVRGVLIFNFLLCSFPTFPSRSQIQVQIQVQQMFTGPPPDWLSSHLHFHVPRPRTGSESAQTFVFSLFGFVHCFLSFCHVDYGYKSVDGWDFPHAWIHGWSIAIGIGVKHSDDMREGFLVDILDVINISGRKHATFHVYQRKDCRSKSAMNSK